jgi:predicted O-methyltransferase YrrM
MANLSLRGRWRRFALGLPTVLSLKPRGWFIPHRYAPLLPPPGALPPYPAIEDLFGRYNASFEAVMDLIEGHAAALYSMRSMLDQGWFPGLDGAAAYALVRDRKPQRVIEVGSGHSTRMLAKAMGGMGEILAIDPAPRADIAGLPGVQIVPSTVQTVALSLFDRLGPGDVLFLDSSHILMPGSDVDMLINRVLPRLPPGVLVHIHDIFLPFDYPPAWGWRAYNEQLGVVPLLATGAYAPVFSSVWVTQRLGARLTRSVVAQLPMPADALATSLWLEKR